MADPIIERLESFSAFRVDAYCEGYPDVIVEIILDAKPTQEQIAISALCGKREGVQHLICTVIIISRFIM